MVKKRPRKRRTHETPRQKAERFIGRKLLRGEIPVIDHLCPTPSEHVKKFDECCKDFSEGKLSETDATIKLGEILKSLKKPEEAKS